MKSNDFGKLELPSNTFDDLGGPIIKKIDGLAFFVADATSKIQDFIIDHPKQVAITAGVLASGLLIALNEKKSYHHQGCDAAQVCSRTGLLSVPFKHGLRPYFLGTAFGSATGVYLKRTQLNRQTDRLLISSSQIKHQVAFIGQKTEANFNSAIRIRGQAIDNNTAAQELFQISQQTASKADNLKCSMQITQQSISEIDERINGLDQSRELIAGGVSQITTNISKMQRDLSDLKQQDKAVNVVNQASFYASIYGISELSGHQARISAQVASHATSLDGSIETNKKMKADLDKSHSCLDKTYRDVAAINKSICRSNSLIESHKMTKTIGTGGLGEG